jgi:hypothetical protein
VAGPALLLNNNKITELLLLRTTKLLNRITGVLEAVRWMLSSSPSAWTRTKAICRSAAGIWSNWYVILMARWPLLEDHS